jgi:alpha-beta hydrolase superfamily lysophospholipase
MLKTTLASVLVIFASGCPDIKQDPGEGQGEIKAGPTVEFDPASSVVPFPNNLVLNPTTGKVSLPSQCNEGPAQIALRTQVLNKLDGFGTYEVGIQATFSTAVDPASLAGNMILLQRTKAGAPVTNPQPIMVALIPGKTLRFDSNCAMPSPIDAVTIVPRIPLDQKSTYTVAILKGVKTADGKDFEPSFTWALVRQSTDPVTLDASGNVVTESTPLDPGGDANLNGIPDLTELKGLDLLWKAHAKALAFLEANGHADRSAILLAWEFNTQTTTDQLDPTVTGSPAAMAPSNPLLATATVIPSGLTPRQFIDGAYVKLGIRPDLASADALCAQLGCDNVGDVLGAGLGAPSYQVLQHNPFSNANDIPGAWDDPVHPTSQGGTVIKTVAFIPAGTPPANGWPVIVFGHGLGSRKESLFVFAPQLASAGFASVAIDFVDHGDRAIRTSSAAALGCADPAVGVPPEPSSHAQCYAPFLSTDLGGTRDNFRQSVLDIQRLVKALKACGTTACTANAPNFQLDGTKLEYTGISLGGILGSTAVATTADLKAAVLNVPGVGWGDILENTETLEIRCTLVDALIDAGVLTGTKWNFSTTAPTGTCATQDWQTQAGYQQFRGAARWVLDPSDGANFTRMLATRRILIQEVVGDQVVPNIATENEGKLVALTPAAASVNPGTGAAPSTALTAMPMANHWLQYTDVAAASPFPGNTYEHASLLRPSTKGGPGAGSLGTQQLQTDAIFFLFANK